MVAENEKPIYHKPVYRMSGIGCQRALAAPRLGYDSIKTSPRSILIMNEASYHEHIVKDRLKLAGVKLYMDESPCKRCFDEFGDVRYGFHVELENSLIRLVGHLDTYFPMLVGNLIIPGEVKSFGKSTWDAFVRNPFVGYQVYLNQMSLYAHGMGTDKCLLLLKNRDNGKVMVYEVGEFDEELHNEVMQIVDRTLGFEYGGQHEMPDAKNIMARVSEVELFIQDGEMPDGEPEEYKCDWCNVRYLCERDRTFAVDVTDEALTQAAELWKEADVRAKIAENDKSKAKDVMLYYAKSHEPKFRTAGLSISYNGMRTRKYIDEATLKRLVPKEIVEKARKESAPWEDIQVRRVKANGEEE